MNPSIKVTYIVLNNDIIVVLYIDLVKDINLLNLVKKLIISPLIIDLFFL